MPQGINYLAVLVAGVVIFMLGGLWYSPVLFAKRWIALQGKPPEDKQGMGASPAMYIQVFICGLVTAFVLDIIIGHFANHPLTAMRGAEVGALSWMLVGAASYGGAIFSLKPKELWAIDAGYNLVSMVIAGAILGAWR